MNTEKYEILRAQNFIPRCDFWFAKTAFSRDVMRSGIVQEVRKRTDVVSDWINQFETSLVNQDSVVFCKYDYLQQLVQYLEYTGCKTPFILMTGQSDYPITDQAYDFLYSKMRMKWWGVNNECQKANGIPLGIADDYCTLTMKSEFHETKGTRLLYVNHRVDTYPTVRYPLYPMFSDKPWATVRDAAIKGENGSYREELLDHKFILCPRGNGVDTHRMWEALYCGVIPIVQRHQVHSYLENSLPVLFVDSYSEIDEKLLNKTYDSFKNKSWNFDMLKVSWWMKKIKEVSSAN
jgi:hypothetical protein